VAAYALCADFLGPGRVLDLGCGVGHSFHLLEPRETVGVDADAAALEGQDRETVVADMRALPFADGSFEGVLAVQSLEHVPDGGSVLAEVRRVMAADGTAVFVTPNRMTFGMPDEIIDPYHHVEYDAQELRDLCTGFFEDVEIHGIFGSERALTIWGQEREILDRVLSRDPLRLRRLVPRRGRQMLYDHILTRVRRADDPLAAAIVPEDFHLDDGELEHALDLVAVCRRAL
jgi:SAM-dependent methyltransferase